VEQVTSLAQVACIEALGEPAVDLGELAARLVPPIPPKSAMMPSPMI
jgi:hypothetical protein